MPAGHADGPASGSAAGAVADADAVADDAETVADADPGTGTGTFTEAAVPASPGAGAPLEHATTEEAARRRAMLRTTNESDYDAGPAVGKFCNRATVGISPRFRFVGWGPGPNRCDASA
jgi:hypothetical protein